MPLPTFDETIRGQGTRPSYRAWMERSIVIPREYGRPGPLRLDGWQGEIADKALAPGVRELSLKLPSQTFKSLFVTGLIMYAAVHRITAIVGWPTELLRDRWIETKLAKFAPTCPEFLSAVEQVRGGGWHKDGLRLKSGGMIPYATGGAAGSLVQVEAQLQLLDEVDDFQHNPFGQTEARGTSMPWTQLVGVGTPKMEGDSLIDWRYGLSNQCRPWVRCPDCREETKLEWRAPADREDPSCAVCESCGAIWPLEYQERMEPTWRPEQPERMDHWGFSGSLLINKVTPWAETVRRYWTWDPEDFANQTLAEIYTRDAETPMAVEEAGWLFGDPGWTGRPLRFLVADVQRRNGGSLSVARVDVYGTATEPRLSVLWQHEIFRLQQPWTDMILAFKREVYQRERPDLCLFDCGDYAAADMVSIVEQVFPRECERGVVRHLRGDGNRHSRYWGTDEWVKGHVGIADAKKRHQTLVLNVNSTKSKALHMTRAGDIRLPGEVGIDYPPDILEQLLSEKIVDKVSRGEPNQGFVKIRQGIHNELFDQVSYSLGGVAYLGPGYRSWLSAEPDEEILESLYGPPVERSPEPAEVREAGEDAGEGRLNSLLDSLYGSIG